MDTYSEIGLELVDWVVNRSAAILIVSATLLLMLLLKKGQLLGYGGLVVVMGAVTLIVFGIENPAEEVIFVLACSLLVLVASTRKRLTQIEDRLASVISALDDLEVAEERRQTYNARHLRLHPRRKSAGRTMEPIVSAEATESPGRETRVVPAGPPWQVPDTRLESAVPATRAAGPDLISEKPQRRLVSS